MRLYDSVKQLAGRSWIASAALTAGVFAWPAHAAAQAAASLPPEVLRYADAIYTNGKVLTVDKDFSIREAIAVRDGKVMATGTTAAIQRMAGPQTKKYDLGGRSMIPGIIDTHWHPWNGAVGRHAKELAAKEPKYADFSNRASIKGSQRGRTAPEPEGRCRQPETRHLDQRVHRRAGARSGVLGQGAPDASSMPSSRTTRCISVFRSRARRRHADQHEDDRPDQGVLRPHRERRNRGR